MEFLGACFIGIVIAFIIRIAFVYINSGRLMDWHKRMKEANETDIKVMISILESILDEMKESKK